jgi:polar amino acid transport system ATP-binding protein
VFDWRPFIKPEILLLDEVTAGLDPELVSEVLDTIRTLARQSMTMLIVSHEMGVVRCRSFDALREARTRGEFVSRILRH